MSDLPRISGATFVEECHPIGTRVFLLDYKFHGTVRAWEIWRGHFFYIVRADTGPDVLAVGVTLERARPRPDWRPIVVPS